MLPKANINAMKVSIQYGRLLTPGDDDDVLTWEH
jgi:hypothetical protein